MHKTATSSLHKAFQALGFDSFHWGAGESPLIWQEMNATNETYRHTSEGYLTDVHVGRSKTLERWYALSDNPIPLLYKQLDKAYPGSKFILTVREEQDWLRSVERLWDKRYNPTRWVWDAYPFSNHIHTVLYGQKDFNAEIFLARYRCHNQEVQQYFKERPDDLLILNIPLGEGWEPLCEFLGKPIPDAPFPWNNNTKQNAFITAAAAIYGEPSTMEHPKVPKCRRCGKPCHRGNQGSWMCDCTSTPKDYLFDGEPSTTEPRMKISRRRRHHHHHFTMVEKWFRRAWWRWRNA
jgi:hypothetical protein